MSCFDDTSDLDVATRQSFHSTLAHKMHPYGPLHFYAATKHAVTAVTESLREELKDATARIRVTVSIASCERGNCIRWIAPY